MQGNIYTAQFSAVAVTAGQDLFSLLAAATSRLRINRIEIGQYSDAGDAQSELLPIQLIRGATVAGSGGTLPTPRLPLFYGPAATAVARANDTTPASGGTPEILYSQVFNVQAGYVYSPNYLETGVHSRDPRILVPVSTRFVVNLPTAPADSLTMSGFIEWEEIGILGT
jgi:hypothetical protein